VSSSIKFVKEIAKYFMDFLETDFHKQRTPKRVIRSRNNDNLLVGLNLGKYPSFNALIWKSIIKAFDKSALRTIPKGKYKTNIPKNLLRFIKFQTEKISQEQIDDIIDSISVKIENKSHLNSDNYEKAINDSLDAASQIIKAKLVIPLIKNIEKSLEDLDLGDENSIFLMEEELTSVLISSINNKISEIIKKLLSKEQIKISQELKLAFQLKDIINSINTFFDDFKVTDIFSELLELNRNRKILDKQQFYLYFCDITFNKVKYPIFYIPFTLKVDGDKLKIEFDSQAYINKKALEYIVQEYNAEKGKKGSLTLIQERIIYIAQHKEDFKEFIDNILKEIVNFFELDSDIDISNPGPQVAKSLLVKISNSCYITLFDKSDEVLINDYEEILQKLSDENSDIAKAFNDLIDDFIHKNPQSIKSEIEEEWDRTKTSERLVVRSPIPLNSEQLKILSAIKKDKCKYITVEGPPGTGKSHTIAAIVFDAILKNQSVLVLSDKKEALDVVEEKITDTMNKVRLDKNFQNPILRLGKTGSTYSQILATTSVENIRTHYRAVKKDYKKLEKEIEKTEKTIKEEIEAEILSYKNINSQEIYELLNLEETIHNIESFIDFDEIFSKADSAVDIEEIRKICEKIRDKIITSESNLLSILQSFGLQKDKLYVQANLNSLAESFKCAQETLKKVKEIYNEKINILSMFVEFSKTHTQNLKNFITKYQQLKNPIFGYIFKKKQVESLNIEFKKLFFSSKIAKPHKHIQEFIDVISIVSYIEDLCNKHDFLGIDYIKVIHALLKDQSFSLLMEDIFSLQEDMDYLKKLREKYPNTFKKIGIELNSLQSLANNVLVKMKVSEFNDLIRYITLKQKSEKEFKHIPTYDNYLNLKKKLEDLVTLLMTYIMDEHLIDFYDNNKSDAKTLRDIIRKKLRFPKDEFLKLKKAFPCILAGIRDFAEYIPLEPNIFDLVIIDEASQVSIAQAFPALLRAKKVLILGDKKQFSNVKSAQARTNINREYLNNLESVFLNSISKDEEKRVKLKKFNIKTSVLEFFEFISNYEAQLKKHFRGYKELISYSNKYFYNSGLEIMKIRAKPISDVLKFSFIEHDGKIEHYKNTNAQEIEFIIRELIRLKENNSKSSVCIITPHTNQQKLFVEEISKLPEKDYLFDNLNLKIFTFDTCQGEERDIVFYSMVATEESDRLWGVFIKDLSKVNLEEEGKIKAQRLNVGFSRAKETMHFVLSKPIDKFTGSIGEALRHYYNILQEAQKEPLPHEVDPKSPMEKQVLAWLVQTEFWRKNFPYRLLLKPQFKIGEYLKQLDKTYNHPNYIVDFLLIYKDEENYEHKIIIEYDGFKEHFKESEDINEFNYWNFYSEDDIYRQKVLESYGYKFLRINKFNVGKEPIATLNARLMSIVKNHQSDNNWIDAVHKTVEGIQNGQMKWCPKCKRVLPIEDFYDLSLISGYGRICKHCKQASQKKYAESDIKCPECGSPMVLRNGRYGKFYGCSRFPYCKGTRQYSL